MDIKYDEYELLELFESEPEDFLIEGAGVYLYRKIDSLGFKLIMIMSVYENTVNLSLSYNEGCVFDVNMESVERVYTRNDILHIQCSEEKKAIEVRFKPHFAINIREF
ncbi:hypothetical protein COE20_28645 [Bacillus cereus]|uniref:Uncharacterized protein n=1 Tax=Bacillus wiedmannii TaxID=1890302 RepID=A0AB37Z1X8_9BACI|nr:MULTISPECIES: hypothetical protein [Bacillus]EOQ22281.1 hypothetical protein KQ1_05858 [Bacillus cereus BAG3O-1]MDI6504829.1 hypothetical protein [Bacillus wiedmannii]MDI6510730.1 hypothetical protein [Bacillus wiedmannii]MED0951998.1 hypothetical protein [Bacillus mobilis]PEW76295.1 hypothetical protein CN424_19265 [Bacillus cereus]